MDLQLIGILVAAVGIIVGVPGALAALKALRRKPESDEEQQPGKSEARPQVAINFPGAPGGQFQVRYWARRPANLHESFVGREDELSAITSALADRRAAVISGGAGSGKSRLAAEYTHRSGVDGFWTTGGTSDALTLSDLAPALGVAVEGKTDEDIAGEVRRRLTAFPRETLWVVDNLPDLGSANALVNVSESVRLLITTRDSRRHLLPATVAYRSIEVLEPEAAIDLLRSRSNFPAAHPTVALIADRVGRLPLALEVLAARLGEPRQSPEKVLEQLDQAPTVLQMETFQEALGATIPRAEGVFASIRGTLDDLGEQDRNMLSGLAYLADAPVPEALAAAVMGVDDQGLTGLLSKCSRQSVLSWSEGQVRIHALTVAVLAATSPEGSLGGVLERALSRLDAINRDDPVALRAELVHHEAMLANAQRRLGVEDASVLSFRNSLAIGYKTAGRVNDAIRLDQQTLEVRERVLGPEHPNTLTSRNNLAIDYRAAGRIDDAIRLLEQTLEVRERVLGPEHPNTLQSRNNLANGYRAAGRIDDAIRLWEQTLEVRERVLGPEHPDTLGSRGNLAAGYGDAGRNDDAIRLDEQTLEARERVLGPEHPDTLSSGNNLAAGYRAAGRIDDAIRLYEQTLEVSERVLGPEHPDTVVSRNNLATSYRAARRVDDAVRLESRSKD